MNISIKLILLTILVTSQITCFEYVKVTTPTAFVVNQETNYQEEFAKVTALSNGGFAIVWHASTAQTGTTGFTYNFNVYLNFYDSQGAKQNSNALLVNIPSNYQQVYPSLCSDGSGGCVVVWEENFKTSMKVYLRHYDSTMTGGPHLLPKDDTTYSLTSRSSIDRLIDGKYVVYFSNKYNGYSDYAQIYDSQFNKIGSNFSTQDVARTDEITQSVRSLLNGGFWLLRNGRGADGSFDVVVKIYDKDGNKKSNDITINTNTVMDQMLPYAASLSNGNVAVVWADAYYNSGDVYAKILDQDGNIILNSFSISTSTTKVQANPFVFALSFGGFGIVWSSNANNTTSDIIMQIFDSTGKKLGNEIIVNTVTTFNMTLPFATEIQSGNIVVSWTSSNQITSGDTWGQIFYKNDGICKDIQLSYNTNTFKIDFSSITYDTVVLRTLPTNGKLQDDKQVDLVLNKFVDKTKVYYVSTNQQNDSFTFATNTIDTACKLDLHYGLCYTTCDTCSLQGDVTDHKCDTCIANYYFQKNTKNCYSKTIGLPGYYFDVAMNLFNVCYSRCNGCIGQGDNAKNNCLKCLDGYYNLEDDASQCLMKTEIINGYFFNAQLNIFSKCYLSCKSCTTQGNINDHQCTSCKNNYFALEDKPTFCYLKDPGVEGYYLDTTASIFKKCYKTCSKCSGSGDIFTPNCLQCLPTIPSCDPCTKMAYQDTCVDNCPVLTTYDDITKICTDCKVGEVVFNNTCVTSCPSGYMKDSNTCKTCSDLKLLSYKDTCVETCPSDSVLNLDTNTCTVICNKGFYDLTKGSCTTCASIKKLYYNYSCVDQCPLGYSPINDYCEQISKLI
jgi:hypothetical protein